MTLPRIVALCAAAAATLAAQHPPVRGEYIEDRTMRVYACPCEWSMDWAHRGREAILAWNITSGEWDGVNLEGLRIAAAIVGDFTLTEATSPRRSAIFIDAAAPPAQQRAGVAWLQSRYAPLIGQVVGVHTAPIAFAISGETVRVQVSGAIDLRIRRARFPQDAQSWAERVHDPFIPMTSPAVGVTTHVSYTGPDLRIRWTREEDALTAYFGTFDSQARDDNEEITSP